MSLKRQINVGFETEIADELARFARVFHQGELAPVVRHLTLFALRQVRTLDDYVAVLNHLASAAARSPSPPAGPSIFERQAEIGRAVTARHQPARKRSNEGR